ncbi:MAG: cell division protein FtsL [Lachnospiraceae bacterium]|nr:cell division protein FtsL [Lachnospiraceae bacterium]
MSRKTVDPVTKFSAAKWNTSNRAESRSGAGAAALAAGRTVTSPAREKAVSVRTKRNRTKALEVDRTYVMFLAVMCLLTVFVCVRYLQLKEIITTQTRTNTRLTAELDTLRNENDALLENVTNEIDLDHIRDVAINELGMKYATEDQIVWYTTEDREYVHQFEDVPAE